MWLIDKNIDDIIIRVVWAMVFWFTTAIFAYNQKLIWFSLQF